MNAATLPERYVIDVEQFFKMEAAGIFRQTPRVELLQGELLTMVPIGYRHGIAVESLVKALLPLEFSGRAYIAHQRTMLASPIDAPQPDILVLRPPLEAYRSRLPRGEDASLIIEVAESSVAFDLERKRRLYARCGVAEYWVLDIEARALWRLRNPANGDFGLCEKLEPPARAAPQEFPDFEIDWAACLAD
jgi:Uma2 family endonuclease